MKLKLKSVPDISDFATVSYDPHADIELCQLKQNAVEFMTAKSLAQLYGVSKTELLNRVARLKRAGADLRMIYWSDSTLCIHAADFRKAVFEESDRINQRKGA